MALKRFCRRNPKFAEAGYLSCKAICGSMPAAARRFFLAAPDNVP